MKKVHPRENPGYTYKFAHPWKKMTRAQMFHAFAGKLSHLLNCVRTAVAWSKRKTTL